MYAHIYRTRSSCARGKFELILTTGAAICEGVISTTYHTTKTAAKRAAKLWGAIPHNY